MSAKSLALVPVEHITRAILVLRGHKVLLDTELAELYGVATKVLLQAVKRNAERFPADFMFQLTLEEWDPLRSQTVTSKAQRGREATCRRRLGESLRGSTADNPNLYARPRRLGFER